MTAGGGNLVPVVLVDTFPTLDPADTAEFRTVVDESRRPPGFLDRGDGQKADANKNKFVDPAFGHSFFVAEIVRRVCKDAKVEQLPAVDNYGASSTEIVAAVLGALLATDPANPGIILLPLGAYTEDDQEPVGLMAVLNKFRSKGWIVVASAGNNASCRPMWPAAGIGVIGVGATGPYGPAPFSNYGSWVSSCAPGVDIVSVVPGVPSGGKLERSPGVLAKPADSYARWSGTSFAAPAVAGAIACAAIQAAGGKEPNATHLVEAASELIDDPALLRIPGLGTVINKT